jgi:phosphatidylethanolamine-binding protein (PEBP) family uncharacterized protein
MTLILRSDAFAEGQEISVQHTCEGDDISPGLVRDIAPKDLPAGTLEGLNDREKTGYGGPCPPKGRHRYFHTLYALDTVLKKLQNPTKSKLEAAMKGHVLARAELVGTYIKKG